MLRVRLCGGDGYVHATDRTCQLTVRRRYTHLSGCTYIKICTHEVMCDIIMINKRKTCEIVYNQLLSTLRTYLATEFNDFLLVVFLSNSSINEKKIAMIHELTPK